MPKTTILAIETSCDETGVAVLQQEGEEITVLAQALASQIDIHAVTGGVVPEVAAREHVAVISPLITEVLQDAKIQEPNDEIDAVAVTVGPGLIPALAVGVQVARTLSYVWGIPIVPVHHIEGHIASALLKAEEIPNPKSKAQNLLTTHPATSREVNYQLSTKELFPALALIVSGGHTMLIEIADKLQYRVIGQTRDDAAGEAFDKVARLLKLPYPGGPHLSALAASGSTNAFAFPRPMINTKDFDFSFSGLKTAVLYTMRDLAADPPSLKLGRASIAASFEQAVVDVLIAKTRRAIELRQPKIVLLAGGVAANKPLRQQLTAMAGEVGVALRIAQPELCGDNAVMIGQVGLLAFARGRKADWRTVDAKARIPLESFSI